MLYLQTLKIMRYLVVIFICILSTFQSYSQINELGVFVGGSNLIGDIGSTNYIAPNSAALGILYKWNRSERHSYRLALTFTDLEGQDSKSDDQRRINRDYEFNTRITELSLGMEFSFVEFDLHNGGFKSTPYIFGGVSVARHKNAFFSNGVQTDEGTDSFAFGIPIGLGFKAAISDHLILAGEVVLRYTFSDELDASMPDADERRNLSVGNINNNDWYTFTGVTLTYTFGRNPCYCVGE